MYPQGRDEEKGLAAKRRCDLTWDFPEFSLMKTSTGSMGDGRNRVSFEATRETGNSLAKIFGHKLRHERTSVFREMSAVVVSLFGIVG